MKNALFIDDDVEYLYLIDRFKKRGKIPNLNNMITAQNGREAIEYLLSQRGQPLPDAMFVDINMPVMDGHEFLEEFSKLREQYEEFNDVVPIAVITSSISEKDRKKISEINFVGQYIVKDIDFNSLTQKINELLK